MNHSQIHFWGKLSCLPTCFASINMSHHFCAKGSKKKESKLYTSLNLQCNLTSGLKFIDLPCCKMPSSCEGKRTRRSQLCPDRQSHCSLRSNSISPARHSFPHLPRCQSSPSKKSLGGDEGRKGRGWKEHFENLDPLLIVGTSASQIKRQDLTSENFSKGSNTIPYKDATSTSSSVGESQRVIFLSWPPSELFSSSLPIVQAFHIRKAWHLIKLYLIRPKNHAIHFSGKYTLEHHPTEGGFGSWFSLLFFIAMTGNKAALMPVSGPQRKRREVILNSGTSSAVTHYLIISHLLVAKEKVN